MSARGTPTSGQDKLKFTYNSCSNVIVRGGIASSTHPVHDPVLVALPLDEVAERERLDSLCDLEDLSTVVVEAVIVEFAELTRPTP